MKRTCLFVGIIYVRLKLKKKNPFFCFVLTEGVFPPLLIAVETVKEKRLIKSGVALGSVVF